MKEKKLNYFSENLRLIRFIWNDISQDDFGKMFKLNRGNINNYEMAGIKPPLDFLFELEDSTGLTIRELYLTKLTKEDIPEKPFRCGENLPILKDKSEQFGFEKQNASSYAGELIALRELVSTKTEMIDMFRAQVKELQEKEKKKVYST